MTRQIGRVSCIPLSPAVGPLDSEWELVDEEEATRTRINISPRRRPLKAELELNACICMSRAVIRSTATSRPGGHPECASQRASWKDSKEANTFALVTSHITRRLKHRLGPVQRGRQEHAISLGSTMASSLGVPLALMSAISPRPGLV